MPRREQRRQQGTRRSHLRLANAQALQALVSDRRGILESSEYECEKRTGPGNGL